MKRNFRGIYFSLLILNLLSFFLKLPLLNTTIAILCISILIINVKLKKPKNIFLYYILNVSIVLTIISSYLRAYYSLIPALPILADLLTCLTFTAFFLKFRIQKTSIIEQDSKQLLIIFVIGFLFIFLAFDSISNDYQILVMLRMLSFAIMIFYGLFRPYVHPFVSYGIILNIFTTFISAITIFVRPNLVPYEFQTILYLIAMYLLNVGILKSENKYRPLKL